jgi:hypothetical protein
VVATPFTLESANALEARRVVVLVALLLGFGFFGSWVAAAYLSVPAVLALIWWSCTRIRSIEVEGDGLGVRRPFGTQFVPFSGLGEFTRVDQSTFPAFPGLSFTRLSFAQAPVASGATYRSYGIFKSGELSIQARFRVSGEGNVLNADELVDLLNKCREQSTSAWTGRESAGRTGTG